MKKISESLVLALPLPFIVFGVAPVTMFLGNLGEYALTWSSILRLLGFVLTAYFFIAALFILARRADKVVSALSGIVLGVSLSALLQIHIFLWDFGPLDGRGIIWENFKSNAKIEIAAWLLICTLMLFFAMRRLHVKGLLAASKGVVFLAAATLIYPLFSSIPKWDTQSQQSSKSIEEAFRFHPENNSIVIVLDTFQGDVFQEISERFAGEVEFLKGFVYYPDAVAGYPTTKHSIPLILTGQFYTNQIPWTDENQQSFYRENYTLPKFYLDKGYGVTGDFGGALVKTLGGEVSFPRSTRDYSWFGLSGGELEFIDAGLFRAAPIALKKSIYKEGKWFLSSIRHDDSSPPPPHGNDFRFVQKFSNSANVLGENNGEFKFIHLVGAHYPIHLNENAEYTGPKPDTREEYLNQARGVLRLTKELIATLKKIGIYDKANIIIVSDHGAHNKQPYDLDGGIGSAVPLVHLGAARPLFLHKPPGGQGFLRHEKTPVHLSFVPCLLSAFESFDCNDAKKSFAGEKVLRKHYRYEWAHDFWFKNFSPPMTLYEVKGDARKISSWKNTKIVYENGAIKPPPVLELGEIIDFGEAGQSQEIVEIGWGDQEENHRWTDGPIATMTLRIQPKINSDLYVRFNAAGYSHDQKTPQDVKLSVNGIEVAALKVLEYKNYSARIPYSLVQTGEVLLQLEMRKPLAPCEITNGVGDCRKLGVALFSIELSKV